MPIALSLRFTASFQEVYDVTHIFFPTWFAQAVEALQADDIQGWMTTYAPDAIHEFPFAAPGAVRRLNDFEAIAGYMGLLPELIRSGLLSDLRVHECGDELIVETTGHHRRVSDDSAMKLSYVWFITRRGGQVTHIRDYMNPLQLSTL